MTLKNVLFLGIGNTARSIMAEAYMNHAGRGLYRAYSAGASPIGEIDPVTMETLRDVGIRCASLSSKSWQLFALAVAPKMDLVVSLLDSDMTSALPKWPGEPELRRWNIADPSHAGGSSQQRKAAFVHCFAELRHYIDAVLLAGPPLGALMEHAARGEVLAMEP